METKKQKNARLQREFHARCKREALEHYGGKCVHCGETNPEVLTLDGPIGRRQIFYQARRKRWPKNFKVVCFNCIFKK